MGEGMVEPMGAEVGMEGGIVGEHVAVVVSGLEV